MCAHPYHAHTQSVKRWRHIPTVAMQWDRCYKRGAIKRKAMTTSGVTLNCIWKDEGRFHGRRDASQKGGIAGARVCMAGSV